MKQPLDHLRSQKKPVSKTVWIIGDSELADELAEAREELRKMDVRLQAQSPDSRIRDELTRAIASAQDKEKVLTDQVRESSLKITVRSIGRQRFNELTTNNQPTDAQLAKAESDGDDKPPWNEDTYPKELVRACMVHPEFENDDERNQFLDWMFDSEDWNLSEQLDVFMACISVNQTRRNLNLGKD